MAFVRKLYRQSLRPLLPAAFVLLPVFALVYFLPGPKDVPIPKKDLDAQPHTNLRKTLDHEITKRKKEFERRAEEEKGRWTAKAKAEKKKFGKEQARQMNGLVWMRHALARVNDGHYTQAQRHLDTQPPKKKWLRKSAAYRMLAPAIRKQVKAGLKKEQVARKAFETAKRQAADGDVLGAWMDLADLSRLEGLPRKLSREIKREAEALKARAEEQRAAAWDLYESALAAAASGERIKAAESLQKVADGPGRHDATLAARARARLAALKTPGGVLEPLRQARRLVERGDFDKARETIRTIRPLLSRLDPRDRRRAQDLLKLCEQRAAEKAVAARCPKNMVPVYSGPFRMGYDGEGALGNERPEHTVYLSLFYIDRNEVTCRRFREFLEHIKKHKDAHRYAHHLQPKEWDYTPKSDRPGDRLYCWRGTQYPEGMDDCPVVLVSFWDAYAYARFRGKRLPSEAEWEKAARGAEGRLWPWGDIWRSDYCNSREAKTGGPRAVGAFAKGVSACGCNDMAGNVWEWCHDWYEADYYQVTPDRNPFGPRRGKYHVIRGGSFRNNRLRCRTYKRSFYAPGLRFNDVGFRCAKDPGE